MYHHTREVVNPWHQTPQGEPVSKAWNTPTDYPKLILVIWYEWQKYINTFINQMSKHIELSIYSALFVCHGHFVWIHHSTLLWHHNGRDGVSNHQLHDCLLNRSFRCKSKKTSKLRFTGLCVGNSPVTGEFPAQKASNAQNVSIWWRHHEMRITQPRGGVHDNAMTWKRFLH